MLADSGAEGRMRVSHEGATRTVILTRRYAIKVAGAWSMLRPGRVRWLWRSILNGTLANLRERDFSRRGWAELCPVIASDPLGVVVVMRRAAVLTAEEFASFDYDGFVTRGGRAELATEPEAMLIPAERKWNSFGWLDGRVVAIDYGGVPEPWNSGVTIPTEGRRPQDAEQLADRVGGSRNEEVHCHGVARAAHLREEVLR